MLLTDTPAPHRRPLRIGSLFAGVGGFEWGLKRAGLGHTVWQVELDPFCRAVLAAHWPNAKRYVDVHDVGAHNLEPVDVLCGGFPCQDISNAGTREGIGGQRSGLWAQFARIIRELRPSVVLVENVAALVNRGLDTVLGALASSGYDAVWDCVTAAAVGAPHKRDRLYLVAWRVSDADGEPVRVSTKRGPRPARSTNARNALPHFLGDAFGSVVADADCWRREAARIADMGDTTSARRQGWAQRGERDEEGLTLTRTRREALADTDCWRRSAERIASRQSEHQGTTGNDADGRALPQWPPGPNDMHAWRTLPLETQPAVCRVAHELPPAMDTRRLRVFGNAVCPANAELIGRLVLLGLDAEDNARARSHEQRRRLLR